MSIKNINIAKRFLELSLNPVPVKVGSKIPLRKEHQTTIEKEEIDSYSFDEIGISTGYASLNLQALDFDTKNADDPDKYMEDFNKRVPKELFSKLVIQRTPSGGFHYIFRCEEIESSKKLARNKKGAAVIETRAVGSYIKTFPSKGYVMVQNDFSKVVTITPEERNLLMIISKQFDELYVKDTYSRFSKEDKDYFRKFPEYNKDYNIGVDLLVKHGWTVHSENNSWVNFTRPDSTSGDLHGGYNKDGFLFQTFSTAQDTFSIGRGYNNHHLYCELECNGNYKRGYAKLYEDGFGTEEEEEDDEVTLTFLSDEIEENTYLDQARKGEIPQGLSTGWSKLDNNFKLKLNSFVFILGLDNIGKSTFLSSLMVATNTLHSLKWGISSPEARNSVTRRNLIEATAGKKIVDFKDSPAKYSMLLKESRDNFFIINNKKHWTIDEILEKGKILYEQYKIDFLLIDPFSFYAGSGEYGTDNGVLSKIRVFVETYCSVVVVDHPYTGFTRTEKDESGYLRIPSKYDASGGNSKANRTDDFISLHRIINHTDRNIRSMMQICVGKVKDKSTGGEPHLDGEYSSLLYESRKGFIGYWDDSGNNPMYEAMMSKKGVRDQMKGNVPTVTPEEAF